MVQGGSNTTVGDAPIKKAGLGSGVIFSLVVAVVSALTTLLLFLSVNEKSSEDIPIHFYVMLFIGTASIVGVIVWNTAKEKMVGDWRLYSVLANSKLAMLVSAAFTFVPIAVSVFKAVDSNAVLPFVAYMYWVSGLSFTLFLLVYKLNAPTVYKFSSFEDLMKKEGGVFILRKDAGNVLKEIQIPEGNDQRGSVKNIMIADRKVLQSFESGELIDGAHVYYAMREYSLLLKREVRIILLGLFVLPAFLITTATAIKTLNVGVEAFRAVEQCGGLGGAIYHEVLDKDKERGELRTCTKSNSPPT